MPASKAHIKATQRYEQKAYDKILVRFRKDSDVNRDTIKAAAEATGQSVNEYIVDAIKAKMNI